MRSITIIGMLLLVNVPAMAKEFSLHQAVLDDDITLVKTLLATLVMAGEYDGITPPEYARQVAGRLGNSTLIEVPAAGHDGETLSDCAVGIIVEFYDDPSATVDPACIDDIPAIAFDVPTEPAEVVLEPYENEALGIRGVAPVGWTEPSPGIFARASSALDPVATQLALAAAGAGRSFLARAGAQDRDRHLAVRKGTQAWRAPR